MTTAPAVTITDELVSELEREMKRCRFDGDEDGPDDPCIAYSVLEALLAERASLLADARRIDWLERQFKTCTVYMDGQHPWSPNSYKLRELRGPTFRIAIDQAM